MLSLPPRFSWKKPTGYAATHCTNCAMGWTRGGQDGGAIIVCLLDREQVVDMENCDRYLSKQEAPKQSTARLVNQA